MRFDLKIELMTLYETWLLNEYPDEVTCKDALFELMDDDRYYDEFIEAVRYFFDLDGEDLE